MTRTGRRQRSRLAQSLLAAPAVLFLAAVFVFPVLSLMALGAQAGFLPYRQAFGSATPYPIVFWLTFRLAAATVALCLALGYPVAFFLATTTRRRRIVCMVFVLLPFWTSLLVRTYAWIALLGRNGLINRTLLDFGVIDAPLPLLYNFGGVLIGLVHVLLPYMVFPVYASLVRIDPDLALAAEGLGARGPAVFWRIHLPLSLNGVLAGTALVFILSLGAFVTPALLGGGRIIMIANVMQQEVSQFLDWPLASALSGVLLLAALAIYGGFHRALGSAREEAR